MKFNLVDLQTEMRWGRGGLYATVASTVPFKRYNV